MTRTDRFVAIGAFIVCLLALLAVLRLFASTVGAFEMLIVVLVAISLTVVCMRFLRPVRRRGPGSAG
jgi:hypothetical protein